MKKCKHENEINKNVNYKNGTIEYDTFCAKCGGYLGHSKFKVTTELHTKGVKHEKQLYTITVEYVEKQ